MKALPFLLVVIITSFVVLVGGAPVPERQAVAENGANADGNTKATPKQLSEIEIARIQIAQGVSDALNSTNSIIQISKSRTLTNLAKQARVNLDSATIEVNNIKDSLDNGNVPRRRDQIRVVRGVRGAETNIDGFMNAAGNSADAQLELNVRNAQTAITNAEGGIQKVSAAIENGGN